MRQTAMKCVGVSAVLAETATGFNPSGVFDRATNDNTVCKSRVQRPPTSAGVRGGCVAAACRMLVSKDTRPH